MNQTARTKHDTYMQIAERVVLALMALYFLFMIARTAQMPFHDHATTVASLVFSFVTSFFTMLLYYFCLSGYTWNLTLKHIFMLMLILFYITNAIIFSLTIYDSKGIAAPYEMLLYTLLYVLSAVYWVAFWLFQRDNFQPRISKRYVRILFYVFFGTYSAIAIVNCFTGFCFYITPDGDLIVHSRLLTLMTGVWFVIYILVALTGHGNIKTRLTLASYAITPLFGLVLLFIFRDSSFYISIYTTLNMLLYLISFYLLFFNLYIEHGQKLLQRENELTKSRINAMTLKISPHFIANTMSSIVALCDSDSAKAGQLASKFAKYLRDNYVDMTEDPMIPFSKELEHIKNYLSIEQIRFENLKVEYDIQVDNFSLPTLTVQPLVENAVRHGISKRPGGSGNLMIRTYQDATDYVIQIKDDGVGFVDPAVNNDRQHIGIVNARYRLETLCNGSLSVASNPGVGSLCEIRIPINKEG